MAAAKLATATWQAAVRLWPLLALLAALALGYAAWRFLREVRAKKVRAQMVAGCGSRSLSLPPWTTGPSNAHFVTCSCGMAGTPGRSAGKETKPQTSSARTAGAAESLARPDRRALDDVFGKDLAGAADASLGLPKGTAEAVIKHILEISYGNFGILDRVLSRAAGILPSKPYPSYRTWTGPMVAITQGIVETLYASGLVTGPEEPPPDAEANARNLWG
ncbi:hypothetical protein I2W78_39485 [Streptomyces spinoverrucosus]|uniref:hypothetical protein n=1 Tax=Streptomyces spinoverrucosus TaxID=284043 RepID=UPI0018C43823|nr:hypothetical protein [Streptomyces spinoverrucosus]MBG0857766.1 hypothetical protein [Streptomyces spinoverrucosus]